MVSSSVLRNLHQSVCVPRLAAAPKSLPSSWLYCVTACLVRLRSPLLLVEPSIWKSCALVQLRPCLSAAELSHAVPLQTARKHLQTFLSSRFNSPGDAAVCVESCDRRAHNSGQEDEASVAPGRASEPKTSQCRPHHRHRVQPALDFRCVAPVEVVAASEVPSPAEYLAERDQRCKPYLLPESAIAGHSLKFAEILVVPILCRAMLRCSR